MATGHGKYLTIEVIILEKKSSHDMVPPDCEAVDSSPT
jgi:hypothetical protein